MWYALAGAWVIGSAIFYTVMVKSSRIMEDDLCSLCENRNCSGCESCTIIEESLRKAA